MQTAHLTGLAHRLEKVAVLTDVTYINDSAATIPPATIAALAAYKTKHIVLILGGDNRRLEFENLGKAMREALIRAIIFIPGNATQHQREQITGEYALPPPMYTAESMSDAVHLALSNAEQGDVVLFSPAARANAFEDEFRRGDQFKAAVFALKQPATHEGR